MNPAVPLRALRLALALLLAPLPALAAVAFVAEAARDFSVPAGAARDTLKQFAAQAQVEIAFPSENTLAVRTNAVSGRLTPQAAIASLLAGTGLRAERDAKTGAYAVRPEAPGPNASAAAPAPAAASPVLRPDASDTPATITLSPFIVNTAQDTGYAATSALEGSRTNTALKDIANPIEVLTKDFIDDLAVTDYQDLVRIAGNVDANVGVDSNSDGIQTSTWEPSRIQIRGFTIQGGSRNFMKLQSLFDAYNSERIAFSRGPNAVLFGSGSPGGSTNYSTKKALLGRDLNSVRFQFDDNQSQRASADFSRVLLKDKLAFRLNLLDEAHNGPRQPESRDQRAVHLTGSLKLTPKTVFTLAYEDRRDHRFTAPSLLPRDFVSTFVDGGRPRVLSVPANGRVNLADGRVNVLATDLNLGTITGTIYRLIDGQLVNVGGTATVQPPRIGGQINYDVILNRGQPNQQIGGPIPNDQSIPGFNTPNFTDTRIFEAFLTHEFTKEFHIEAAFGQSDLDIFTGHAVTTSLNIDPNAGPRFGQYYAEAPVFTVRRDRKLSDARLTASYDLDLTRAWKWLGRHRLAALAERNIYKETSDGQRLTRTGTPAGSFNPYTVFGATGYRNGNAQLQVRGYLDPARGIYSLPDFGYLRHADTFTTPDGFTFTNLRVQGFAQRNTRTDEDTLMGIVQSYWLNERLVTTFGYRDDATRIQIAEFVATNNPATAGAVNPGDSQIAPRVRKAGADPASLNPRDAAFTTEAPSGGLSRNFGGVLNVTKWAALTYNQASNFQPTTERANNLLGERSKDSQGTSQDYGVRLALFGGKIRIDALKYDTIEGGSVFRSDLVGANQVPFLAIDEILNDFNRTLYPRRTEFAGNVTTVDTRAQGEELSLTANPSPQWNFRLTAKAGRARRSNIAPEIRAFYNQGIDEWRRIAAANPNLRPASDVDGSGRTLAEQVDLATAAIQNIALRESAESFPSSKQQVRFTGRYNFGGDGPLKGLAIGTFYNWNSAPVVGYFRLADGSFDLKKPYKGEDTSEVSLFFTYGRRLTKKVRWTIQLNIDNALDDDKPRLSQVVNRVGGVDGDLFAVRHRPGNGRIFKLTTTFDF
jgi:outer membrane receptor protein involved in Fe transport